MRAITILKVLTGFAVLASLPGQVIAQNRVAFVSSATGSSNMSSWAEAVDGLTGLEAADSICINLAETAGLANSVNFVAWLSNGRNDAYCRVQNLSGQRDANCGQDKLPVDAGPWVLSNGRVRHGKMGGKEYEMRITSLVLDGEAVSRAPDCPS